jgi:tetratricopeptide (TPR) repeat protein
MHFNGREIGMAARLAVGVLAVCMWLRPASADVESELVKSGVAAYEDLEYATAVKFLNRALSESLTREEKMVTFETLGFCQVALGDLAQAKTAFQELLRIAPSFELDRTISPRVRAVFQEAKDQLATSGLAVQGSSLPSVHTLIEPQHAKQGRAVTVRVDYPGGVAEKMRIFYRTRGTNAFSAVTVSSQPAGRFTALVPGLQVKAPALEYYVELLDETGTQVAGAGALGQPIGLEVAASKRPLYAKAWFWGTLGGVLVAGAVAATAATLATQHGAANGQVQVTFVPH